MNEIWFESFLHVLSLEQLLRSKRSVGRPKDKVHLVYIQDALALRKKAAP